MPSDNSVTLVGNVTRDPELRALLVAAARPNAAARFTLASPRMTTRSASQPQIHNSRAMLCGQVNQNGETGKPPFPGGSVAQKLMRHAMVQPVDLSPRADTETLAAWASSGVVTGEIWRPGIPRRSPTPSP